jgi:hypothetical protein
MWRKRLWCLALLSVYPVQDMTILQWFPEVIHVVDNVICEEISEEGQARVTSMASSMLAISIGTVTSTSLIQPNINRSY